MRRALAAVAAVASLSCAPAPIVTAATDAKVPPRQPDGVLLDPPPALPSAEEHAHAQGVIALREPVASSEVDKVVLSYVRSFIHEDLSALDRLLTDDARQLF